jgi:hypothetical protein
MSQPQPSFETQPSTLDIILQRLDEMQKQSQKGVWSLQDLTLFFGRSTTFVYGLIKASPVNGFPLPRRATVEHSSEKVATDPYWLPDEVKKWTKEQPKDLGVLLNQKRKHYNKS